MQVPGGCIAGRRHVATEVRARGDARPPRRLGDTAIGNLRYAKEYREVEAQAVWKVRMARLPDGWTAPAPGPERGRGREKPATSRGSIEHQ